MQDIHTLEYSNNNPSARLEYQLSHSILPHVRQHVDTLRFAERAKIGIEDVVACLLYLVLQHLHSPGTAARALRADLLIQKLQHLNIPTCLLPVLATKTGAPQGGVLRPFLYNLYNNGCTRPSPTTIFPKYADDTAILNHVIDSGQEYYKTSPFTLMSIKQKNWLPPTYFNYCMQILHNPSHYTLPPVPSTSTLTGLHPPNLWEQNKRPSHVSHIG